MRTVGVENPSAEQGLQSSPQFFALFVFFKVRRKHNLPGRGKVSIGSSYLVFLDITLRYCGSVVTIYNCSQRWKADDCYSQAHMRSP